MADYQSINAFGGYGGGGYGYGQPNQNAERARQMAQRTYYRADLANARARENPQAKNTPGSGVMSPNSLARPPSWQTNYAPSLDAFHPAFQGGAPTVTNPQNHWYGGGSQVSAYPQQPDWRGQEGIANPPPTNAQKPQQVTTYTPNAAPNPGARPASGTPAAGAWASNVEAGNKAYYSMDPYSTRTVGAEPGVNSPQIQGALNDVNTQGAIAAARQNGSAISPYGSIAAHDVPQGTPQPTAAETAAATTSTGVQHAPPPPPYGGFSDQTAQGDARNELRQNYPEIFTQNTPQNTAFVNYAKQYGEPAAHQNIQQFMGAISKPVAANPNPQNGQTNNPPGSPQVSPY